MTVRIELRCDAMGCDNRHQLYDDWKDRDILAAGWHAHPGSPDDHCCPECWPVVKKEIEEFRGQSI